MRDGQGGGMNCMDNALAILPHHLEFVKCVKRRGRHLDIGASIIVRGRKEHRRQCGTKGEEEQRDI